MRLSVLLSLVTLPQLLVGCIGKPACTDDGSTAMGIAEARLPQVAGVRAEGVCAVSSVPTTCGGDADCYEDAKGKMVALVRIRSTKQGPCTVTVDFNDGCASTAFDLEFRGPSDNCCEDVCARSGVIAPIPAACGAAD